MSYYDREIKTEYQWDDLELLADYQRALLTVRAGGDDRSTQTVWKAFNFITCDDYIDLFTGCFVIYAGILLFMTGLSIVEWLYYNKFLKS